MIEVAAASSPNKGLFRHKTEVKLEHMWVKGFFLAIVVQIMVCLREEAKKTSNKLNNCCLSELSLNVTVSSEKHKRKSF